MTARIQHLILFLSLIFVSPAFGATDWTANANTKIAHKFEETSGNYLDSSSNGNHGIIEGSVTRGATGKFGSLAVRFTQVNNAAVRINSSTSLNNIDPITVCVWANNNSDGENSVNTSDAGYIIEKNIRSWMFALKQTNKLRWLVHYSGGNTSWDTSNAVVGYGAFEHYAVVHQRSAGASPKPVMYVNGVSVGLTSPTPSGTIDNDTGTNIYIGISTTGGVNEADAIYDELLVNAAILTSTDINEVMDCGLDGLQCAGATYSGRGLGRGLGRGIVR